MKKKLLAMLLAAAMIIGSFSTIAFAATTDIINQNGKWVYTVNGQPDYTYTGIAQNKNGWWRVEKGVVNFNANGIYQNQYGWWKTTDGKVTFNETGVFQNENGWWYIENSKVQFNYTGIKPNNNGWWRIENGRVNFNATGVYQNENGWWRVENGKVNFDAWGLYQNQYGWWHVDGGKVQFDYTGYSSDGTQWWRVVNGKRTNTKCEMAGIQTIIDNYGLSKSYILTSPNDTILPYWLWNIAHGYGMDYRVDEGHSVWMPDPEFFWHQDAARGECTHPTIPLAEDVPCNKTIHYKSICRYCGKVIDVDIKGTGHDWSGFRYDVGSYCVLCGKTPREIFGY